MKVVLSLAATLAMGTMGLLGADQGWIGTMGLLGTARATEARRPSSAPLGLC